MYEIDIIKRNVDGDETWRYRGRVLSRSDKSVIIEAFFDRPDTSFHGMVLAKGDRFVEVYYSDRWYNIFEIYDRITSELKGWYCNVTRPARFRGGTIEYNDLALDLLVQADGTQIVLDEEEFAELKLDDAVRNEARRALTTLQELVRPGFKVELNS
jgi:protein associated with RNAse G/E